MKPRISMITLGVRNLVAATRFYEQGLGLPKMDSPPGVAFFTLSGSCSRRQTGQACSENKLGRIRRLFCRSRWIPVGGCP